VGGLFNAGSGGAGKRLDFLSGRIGGKHANDAEPKWIAVNGVPVPLDEDGQPQGKVGEKIKATFAQSKPVSSLNGKELEKYTGGLPLSGENAVASVRAYYQQNLQGKPVDREGFGSVRLSAKGLAELRCGVKKDLLKAQLVPAIPDIIKHGKYRGPEPLYKERKDGIVTFHFFEAPVSVGEKTVRAGVTVGEDRHGNLFYDLGHEGNISWKNRERKEAQGKPRSAAEAPEPLKGANDATLDGSIEEDEWGINMFVDTPAPVNDSAETSPVQDSLAFDASCSRRVDENGFMRVSGCHISKEGVNEYWGREIPRWRELGLTADRIYGVYRPASELEKAADTFSGLPLLSEHVRDSAENPRKDYRIGNLGTDAAFEAPYLDATIIIQDAEAIRALSGEGGQGVKRELSASYSYVPALRSGQFNGKPYDLVMTRIRGNHVAVVTKGRAGPDVLVADEAMKHKELFSMIDQLAQDMAMDEQWITVHPNGEGSEGTPVLLDDGGKIMGGMGGKFTGQKIGEIRKDFVGPKSHEARKPEQRPGNGTETNVEPSKRKQNTGISAIYSDEQRERFKKKEVSRNELDVEIDMENRKKFNVPDDQDIVFPYKSYEDGIYNGYKVIKETDKAWIVENPAYEEARTTSRYDIKELNQVQRDLLGNGERNLVVPKSASTVRDGELVALKPWVGVDKGIRTMPNNNSKRKYLNVPYARKDEAKAAGARWNPDRKKWYFEGDLPDGLKEFASDSAMAFDEVLTEEQLADLDANYQGDFKHVKGNTMNEFFEQLKALIARFSGQDAPAAPNAPVDDGGPGTKADPAPVSASSPSPPAAPVKAAAPAAPEPKAAAPAAPASPVARNPMKTEIQAADAETITASIRAGLVGQFNAARDVRPLVGDLDAMAFDSAASIYAHALKLSGRETKVADAAALKEMCLMACDTAMTRLPEPLASDSLGEPDTRFAGLSNIRRAA
jgi:hypothetical protein